MQTKEVFERPIMPEPPGHFTREELILWYENVGQIFLAKSKALKGSIQDTESALLVWSVKYAPLIRMILDDVIFIESVDWDDARKRAQEAMHKG